MNVYEIITIIALLAGPISAVQVEKFLSRKRERKHTKMWIFKTLMVTRASILSREHVQALNSILLEFSDGKRYQKVIERWKEYFDNLCQTVSEENVVTWSSRNEELLADLLVEMGQSLGYNFDRVLIKRTIYLPKWHDKIERENQGIREEVLKILQGEGSFPMHITSVEPDVESNNRIKEIQELSIQYYKEIGKLQDLQVQYYKKELEKKQ